MLNKVLAVIALATIATQAIANDTVRSRFPKKPHTDSSTFSRMFPELDSFAAQTDQMRNNAELLGAKGGILDAADDLSDPLQSILQPEIFSPNNPDNLEMSAGVTFIGQFLDHDITFDRRSALRALADPSRTVNSRSAAFDLDSVYGEGPRQSPELYVQTASTVKMLVEEIPGSDALSRGNFLRYDVPRDQFGEAFLGDSRNDEHVILSQFHLAMLRFHNAVTDRIRADAENSGLSAMQVFERAKREVQWHYQWIIVNQFLPQLVGQERINQMLDEGLPYFHASQTSNNDRTEQRGRNQRNGTSGNRAGPQIPIEFSVAAYRFGHSQVRPSYRMNFGADDDSQIFALVFDDQIDPNTIDPDDFRGGQRSARRFVDWQTFFDFGDGNVRNNKLIDSKLSSILFNLPGATVPLAGLPSDGVQSLASRNLIRHINFGLPSGQDIARTIGATVLTDNELNDLAPFGMAQSTPLWVYVLKEAELLENGQRLGPVGARIVGEVFLGLLTADRKTYLSANPDWQPTLPSRLGAGQFDIVDLLTIADVVTPIQ
jgi:hypothetical protein